MQYIMKTYKAQSAQRTLQWNTLVVDVHIKHLDAKTHFQGGVKLRSDTVLLFQGLLVATIFCFFNGEVRKSTVTLT